MKPLDALIIDDDENFRLSLEMLVQRQGFATRSAGSAAEARTRIAESRPDVLIVDISLPDADDLAWLRDEPAASGAEVIVITGNATVDSAILAIQGGALDYLTKPIDRARLRAALMNVSRTRALKAEAGSLRNELRDLGRFGRMVGRSASILAVYDLVARVAPTDATVFIRGESGTGKELVAETIHQSSGRKNAPMLPVNCGSISPNLIESELFGHERGSFTGAEKQRKGCFERASGGTLFLDEVTEMPIELQVKLLRVLETGTVVRVGGNEPIAVDVRVIAATNRNPEESVKSGQLREDLYYRLNVFPISLPPLRERPGDIELLASHFLERLNRESGTSKRWTRGALERLNANAWHGNVRELKNVVQRAFIMGDLEIGPAALPLPADGPVERGGGPVFEVRAGSPIAEVEQRLILATLELTGGDKKRCAELLGISLKTLYNRLNVYGSGRVAQAVGGSMSSDA
jgi:two-component system, NtrC family, response regulator AtoC